MSVKIQKIHPSKLNKEDLQLIFDKSDPSYKLSSKTVNGPKTKKEMYPELLAFMDLIGTLRGEKTIKYDPSKDQIFFSSTEGHRVPLAKGKPPTLGNSSWSEGFEHDETQDGAHDDEEGGKVVQEPAKTPTPKYDDFKKSGVPLKEIRRVVKEAQDVIPKIEADLEKETKQNAKPEVLESIRKFLKTKRDVIKKFEKLKEKEYEFFETANEEDPASQRMIEKILKRISTFDAVEAKKAKPSITELFEKIPETAEELDAFVNYVDENHKGKIPKSSVNNHENIKIEHKETEKKLNHHVQKESENKIDRLFKSKLMFEGDKIDRIHKRNMNWGDAVERLSHKRF